jgi:hypothetical protein
MGWLVRKLLQHMIKVCKLFYPIGYNSGFIIVIVVQLG